MWITIVGLILTIMGLGIAMFGSSLYLRYQRMTSYYATKLQVIALFITIGGIIAIVYGILFLYPHLTSLTG